MNTYLSKTQLGANLYAARKMAGLRQAEVAEKIGIARTSIVAYEQGVATPPDGKLSALAALYGCGVDILTNSVVQGTVVVGDDSNPYSYLQVSEAEAALINAVREWDSTRAIHILSMLLAKIP